MNPENRIYLLALIGSIPLFAGCGGGGSDEAPAPPGQGPNPPPTPVTVTILANPVPGLFASLGSSSTNEFSDVDDDSRLTDVSLESALQPLLRYTASGNYELQLPGAAFDRLVPHESAGSSTAINNLFRPSAAPRSTVILWTELSRFDGYRYSELAGWRDSGAVSRAGTLAFGTPTPTAAIPASGSASYRGRVNGTVDLVYFDGLGGGTFFSGTPGTIALTVDFAARTVTGTLEFSVDHGPITYTVPLSANTFQSGADTWSGLFETSESGFNEFKVRLTGPDANEVIGSWSIPLVINGEPHQLMGAWIAVRE